MQSGFASLDFEEPYAGLPRDGSVLVTTGIVMMVMASIPAMFLYDGYRVGSDFCLIWTLVQGGIGFVLAVAGFVLEHRSEAVIAPKLERWILSDETTP